MKGKFSSLSDNDYKILGQIMRDLESKGTRYTTADIFKHPLFKQMSAYKRIKSKDVAAVKIMQDKRDLSNFTVQFEGTGIDLTNPDHEKIVTSSTTTLIQLLVTAVRVFAELDKPSEKSGFIEDLLKDLFTPPNRN